MVSTPKVAVLAFLMREAATAPFRDGQFHLEELVSDSADLNLAELVAGSRFGDAEWSICELLAQKPAGFVIVQCAGDLHAAGCELHAEALLHAAGSRGKRTRAQWAEPFMERWSQVRAALRSYELHGLATSFGDLREGAEEAYMEHEDVDVVEFLERYPVRRPEPVPACARELVWDG